MSVLSECRFYGIIDLGYVQESDITHVAEQMIEGTPRGCTKLPRDFPRRSS